jgi:hypothetical protein
MAREMRGSKAIESKNNREYARIRAQFQEYPRLLMSERLQAISVSFREIFVAEVDFEVLASGRSEFA